MTDTETITGDRIYYDGQERGFTIIAEIDDPNASYDFSLLVVVRDPEGKLWAATDSGCSCPTPFEDVTWPTDWTPARSWADIEPLADECHRKAGSQWLAFRSDVEAALAPV